MRGRCCWTGVMALLLLASSGCKEKKLKPDENKQKEQKQKKKEKKKEEKKVEADSSKPATVGLVSLASEKSAEKVVAAIEKRLEEARGVSIQMKVDHKKNAESVDAKLEATTLLAFTNPQLDIPFVQESIRAGLDYPQKILVWSGEGTTHVTFNAPAYVAKRHGIERLGLQLGRQEEGLSNTIGEATGSDVPAMPKKKAIGIKPGQGVVKKESDNGVSDTFQKLQEILKEKEGVSIMGTFDYQSAAGAIDKEIRPAKLVVFGNPKLGTPLMEESRTVAVDLPQKMYVYENKKGAIYVAYNSPQFLATRHGIPGSTKQLKSMKKALDEIASEACKEITD